MIACELCGKELKTTQGLRGHKNFVHGLTASNTQQSVARQASEQQVSLLEDRLQRVERVTGLDEPALDLSLSDTEPLTEKLSSITEQVTLLSDIVSKLSQEVKLNKVTRDAENKEFSKRLTDLWEAHNGQATLINEHRNTSSNNFDAVKARIGKVEKMVENLDKGLNTIGTKLAAHGRDGLSAIAQLSSGLKQVVAQIAKLQAEVARAKVLAVRKPTDDFERVKLTDGSEHAYRVYKGKRGLSNPHRISIDPFSGDKYVDLAEPVD